MKLCRHYFLIQNLYLLVIIHTKEEKEVWMAIKTTSYYNDLSDMIIKNLNERGEGVDLVQMYEKYFKLGNFTFVWWEWDNE